MAMNEKDPGKNNEVSDVDKALHRIFQEQGIVYESEEERLRSIKETIASHEYRSEMKRRRRDRENKIGKNEDGGSVE